jgi:dihydroorotate dehydrogenase (fumarate)
VDLTTRYLGLDLPHPFMPGASPLDEDLDMVMRLEDAGAAALVLHSLFEEDIVKYGRPCDRYLEHIVRIKRRAHLPIIASLNGTTSEGWLRYAGLIERAGARALELNFYHVATDLLEDAKTVESRVLDIVAVLKESIRIPLAVKLSPFYSALPHFAAQLDRIGTNGLVLFNRFYQPDIDPERRNVSLHLKYSDSSELLLRLRWIAILSGRVSASLALSGGVHEPIDAVKGVMAGADAVQLVSVLLKRGPAYLKSLRDAFERWGDDHGFASISDMRGCANLARCGDPRAFERGNYVELIRCANRLGPAITSR